MQWHGITFHPHVPVTPETKQAAEAELMRLVVEHDVELVMLARYMQILSADLDEGPIIAQQVHEVDHADTPRRRGRSRSRHRV